jgi:hypothetical protein
LIEAGRFTFLLGWFVVTVQLVLLLWMRGKSPRELISTHFLVHLSTEKSKGRRSTDCPSSVGNESSRFGFVGKTMKK